MPNYYRFNKKLLDQSETPGAREMVRAFGAVRDHARSMVHGLARRRTAEGEVGIRGYWPETNPEPLFKVYGGWMTAADLLWVAEHAQRIAAVDDQEGAHVE